MGLNPIPLATYRKFAIDLFQQFGRTIDADAVDSVYSAFDGVTWYVQMVMNELFALTSYGEHCPQDRVQEAIDNVILAQESQYKELLSLIPPKQKQVLQAVAREGRASGITSAAFIRRYQLPSASSIQSAVKGLLEKEIITTDEGTYRIYDYFFSYWMAHKY